MDCEVHTRAKRRGCRREEERRQTRYEELYRRRAATYADSNRCLKRLWEKRNSAPTHETY